MRIENGKWRKVKLKDAIIIDKKSILPNNMNDEDIYIGLEDIDKETGVIKTLRSAKECDVRSNKFIFTSEHILYGKLRPNLNKVAVPNFNGICSTDIYPILTQKGKAVKGYIYHILHGQTFVKYASSRTNGANLPRVNEKIIIDYEIPLPPLETQKKIAKTLDTAAELLTMRKQQLAELDNLIKSTFYDMFGNPVTNEKGWKVSSLNDLCIKITDGTHDTPKRVVNGVLFITGKNIRSFSIDLSDVEYVSPQDHEIIYKRCNPQKGDILYTNIGVNYGTAAKCTLDFEFSMKNVALLKIDIEVTASVYLECVLNYKRDFIINQNQTGGAQTFMGLATIKKIFIAVPPIDLQNQFATIVTIIEEHKALVKKAIDETQCLFDSLMSEYFE